LKYWHRVTSSLGTSLWLGGILLALAWEGCSVERNYKTLSLFFDGVPSPEARAKAAALSGINPDARKSPTYSLHKPFGEDRCTDCHNNISALTSVSADVCMKCHKQVPTEYARMHGPVAAGACLWCHSPHESPQAHLLKKPAREVCIQCHEAGLLDATRIPAHADAAASCLDCHGGHGGPAAYFLREGISRTATPMPPAERTLP
jgi:predicted CXXCH cytochrome family protein